MQNGAITSTIHDSAKPYLFVLIAGVVFSKFGQYLWQYVWPEIPLIYGQAPGIYVKGALTAAAAVLWLLYRGHRTHDRWLTAFLWILALGWIALIPIATIHNDGLTYDMALYVPAVLALWLKTPPKQDLLSALTFLGWLITGILVGTRAAEMIGLVPMVDVGRDLLAFETSNYWLPLAGILGPEGRWPGPMGHNAMTGNAAAMLVILAVGMKGKSRWVFGAVGILTLLITASRGSQLGAIAGATAIIVLGDNPLTRKVGRKVLLWGIGVAALAVVAFTLIRNPNLTGRTTYWSIALDAWQTSPLLGVGVSGFGGDSELSIAGNNAHNLIFDAIVKYGLVGAVFIIAVLGAAGATAIRAATIRAVLPIGIFATYLTIGLAESDQGWLTFSLPWLWLVLAVLLAGQSWEEREGPDSSAHRGREPLTGGGSAEGHEAFAREQ